MLIVVVLCMLLVTLTLAGIKALGAHYLSVGWRDTLEQMRERVEAECRRRLECVAPALDGKLIDGPALQTASGVITLYASHAPKNMVLDLTTFTAPVSGTRELSVVRDRDAACAILSRVVRPVESLDPALVAGFRVTASDEAFARAVVTRALLDAVRSLDANTRSRTHFLVRGGTATVVANRGLSSPGDFRAFHDGSAEIVRLVRLGESS